MNFVLMMMQYLPTILTAVQTVESISATMTKKPASKDKLAAAIGMVAATAPALAQSMASQPENATHAENVISGVVSAMKALNGWATQQDAVAP